MPKGRKAAAEKAEGDTLNLRAELTGQSRDQFLRLQKKLNDINNADVVRLAISKVFELEFGKD